MSVYVNIAAAAPSMSQSTSGSAGMIETASQLATVFTVGVAILALVFAWWQVKQGRAITREATATNLFYQSLMLNLQYPHFGDPAALQKFDRKAYNQYDWFVCAMLLASEEILRITNCNREWFNSVKKNLSRHSEYFLRKADEGYEFSDFYDMPLVDIVNQIVTETRGGHNA